MSQPDLFVGIDVAKDELVIHLHPIGTLWRVANSKTGLAMLGRKLTRLAGTACLRIGFEASGGYERKLAILLDRLGLTAYLLDPARDCQDFRVRAGIMGTRSSPYVTTQRTNDTERTARPVAGGRHGQRCL